MYSLRWSSRTLSMGYLGLATMPSRLPPGTSMTKAGSLPSTCLVDSFPRYYEPLGLPPSTIPFRRRLIGIACADVAAGTGLSCSALNCVDVPSSVPRRRPAPSESRCSLLPSPWHERLGHLSLSGAYVSGLQGSLHVGPADLPPSRQSFDHRRAFDAPLRRQGLPLPSGACYTALRRLP